VSFDFLAPHYRWLETLAFGDSLQRARTCWINKIARPNRTLIVGEGNGRFLCELLRVHPGIAVDCIDASREMLRRARARLLRTSPESIPHVRFLCKDILNWSPQRSYDLLVTHFVLDCFPRPELRMIVNKCAAAAEPGAFWLIADFILPPTRFARVHAQLWLWLMYSFFGITAGIKAKNIVDPHPILAGNRFVRASSTVSRAGMLRSDLYRAAISSRRPAKTRRNRGASCSPSACAIPSWDTTGKRTRIVY
jgi:SAM-dependent methyltransferase